MLCIWLGDKENICQPKKNEKKSTPKMKHRIEKTKCPTTKTRPIVRCPYVRTRIFIYTQSKTSTILKSISIGILNYTWHCFVSMFIVNCNNWPMFRINITALQHFWIIRIICFGFLFRFQAVLLRFFFIFIHSGRQWDKLYTFLFYLVCVCLCVSFCLPWGYNSERVTNLYC